LRQQQRRQRVIVEFKGSKFVAERDQRGLYVCPICRNYMFYSEKDLVLHIVAHARNTLSRIRPAPRRH
jgi:uncharacterized C2H2 Zn-finger protein